MKQSLDLNRYKSGKTCPVVAVTAYTDMTIVMESRKVGIKEVLNKPVCAERLKEIIVKYTDIIVWLNYLNQTYM